MRDRTLALIIGALALGLALAACGGDDDDSATATGGSTAATSAEKAAVPAPGEEKNLASSEPDRGESRGTDATEPPEGAPAVTKAEFVRQANSICRVRSREISAVAGAAFRRDASKPNYDPEATEIKLVPTVLAPTLQREVDELEALPIPRGEEEKVEAIVDAIQVTVDEAEADPEAFVRSGNPYAQAEGLADAYGLAACPIG